MASHGGYRNRSGNKPVEGSARSDRRGYKLEALPAEGYQGPIPAFPLPNVTDRELEVWESAWRTPQACAWSLPSESWRIETVALWVRVRVRCEDPDAMVGAYAQLHRFADQIGMTTAGLAEMGWKIAAEDVKPSTDGAQPVKARSSARSRAESSGQFEVIAGGKRAG